MIGAITAGLYGTGVPPVTNSYESIATINPNGSSSTVTFSSIPSTYKHLQVRLIARWNESPNYGLILRANGDSGSNYSAHLLTGDGSSAGANSYVSSTFAYPLGNAAGSGLGSNIYSTVVIDLLDYQNTNKNKTVRALGGYDANGSGQLNLSSSAWYNTAAINSITVGSTVGTFTTASQIALYGIKG